METCKLFYPPLVVCDVGFGDDVLDSILLYDCGPPCHVSYLLIAHPHFP